MIREFYAFYRTIREDIPVAVPFWPLGFAKEGDGQMALGLRWEDRTCRAFLAVWRLDGDPTISLPIQSLVEMFQSQDMQAAARIVFPKEDTRCRVALDAEKAVLRITMPEQYMARIIEITAD